MNRNFLSLSLSIFLHAVLTAALLYWIVHTPDEVKKSYKKISLNSVNIVQPEPVKKPILTPPKPIKQPIVKKKPIKKVIKKTPSKPKPKKIVKKRSKPKSQPKIEKIIEQPVIQKETIKKVEQVKTVLAPTPPKQSHAEKYLSLNLAQIKSAIERAKYYPKVARRLRQEGTIKVTFILTPGKQIENITAAGGSSILKKAAIKAIKRASVNFPAPKNSITLTVPIVYQLR